MGREEKFEDRIQSQRIEGKPTYAANFIQLFIVCYRLPGARFLLVSDANCPPSHRSHRLRHPSADPRSDRQIRARCSQPFLPPRAVLQLRVKRDHLHGDSRWLHQPLRRGSLRAPPGSLRCLHLRHLQLFGFESAGRSGVAGHRGPPPGEQQQAVPCVVSALIAILAATGGDLAAGLCAQRVRESMSRAVFSPLLRHPALWLVELCLLCECADDRLSASS
jgi:hypothetical protein